MADDVRQTPTQIDVEDPTRKSVQDNIEGYVVCPFCNLQSKDLTTLKMHILNIHGNNEGTQNNHDEIIIEINETCTKCIHCDYVGNGNEIQEHLQKNHRVTSKCGECGNIFPDETSLKDHSTAKHSKTQTTEPFPC